MAGTSTLTFTAYDRLSSRERRTQNRYLPTRSRSPVPNQRIHAPQCAQTQETFDVVGITLYVHHDFYVSP